MAVCILMSAQVRNVDMTMMVVYWQLIILLYAVGGARVVRSNIRIGTYYKQQPQMRLN